MLTLSEIDEHVRKMVPPLTEAPKDLVYIVGSVSPDAMLAPHSSPAALLDTISAIVRDTVKQLPPGSIPRLLTCDDGMCMKINVLKDLIEFRVAAT